MVYVRGATNEDLSIILKRVVFQLHPGFNNPTRVVESLLYELSESGWGEFEIAISLYFRTGVCDKRVDVKGHKSIRRDQGANITSVFVSQMLYWSEIWHFYKTYRYHIF